jgi:geranylgeranyl pyrophosphate synthase
MQNKSLIGSNVLSGVGFLSYLDEKLARVDQKMIAGSLAYHPDLKAALEYLLNSGGKRIRPTISILMGSMLGAEEEKIISLSASIELLHTATLVHDDLIDGALLRRGNPTLNSHWSPAATVLAGDYIFAQAALLAAEIESTDAMKLFAETLSIIVNGELSQLFDRDKLPSREDYYHRIYEKTGSLFALSAKAATLISPADRKLLGPAQTYGREIGNAFQIVDDILDFTGDESRVGKPIGSDLRQGVPTLPVIYYAERHADDQTLAACLRGGASEQQLGELIDRIVSSGMIQLSLDEAKSCVEKALESLKGFPDGKNRDNLEKLGQYIVDRDL